MRNKILIAICVSISANVWALHCSNPITLSDPQAENIYGPRVAMNAHGDAAIAWVADLGTAEAIQVSVRPRGGTWSDPVTVGPHGKDLWYHHITVDSSGKVSLCWKCDDFYPDEMVYFVEKSPNEYWPAPFEVVFPEIKYPESGFRETNTALFPDGGIISVGHNSIKDAHSWQSSNFVQSLRMFDGDSIYPPVVLSEPSHGHVYPYIFMNTQGNGLCVWERREYLPDSENTIECSWYENGVWSPVQTICSTPGEGHIYISKACIDNKDNSVIAWAVANKIQVATYSHGKWSIIDLPPTGEGECPSVAVNKQGDTLVMWETEKGPYSIGASYKPVGQDWMYSVSPPALEGSNSRTRIACDQSGNFVTVWVKAQRNRESIYGAIFSPETQTWSEPVLLSPEGESCFAPCLVLSENGKGLLSWTMTNGFDDFAQVAELHLE